MAIICCVLFCITLILIYVIPGEFNITVHNKYETIEQKTTEEETKATQQIGFAVPNASDDDVLTQMLGTATELFTGGDRISAEESK